jgi:endonuclease/exonuclease/phosphatase family metal-dependent hydrolase
MTVRLATFNIENLLTRFDFSGFHNLNRRDRAMQLFDVKDEATYKLLESARALASTDDTRQLTALAIAATDADILCLQEVDNMEALNAFEYGYLFRMVGNGYRQKILIEGNDGRGIDVAVIMRDETRHGEKIELISTTSHAHLTYREMGLFNADLAQTNDIDDKVFKRDCLELDLRIGGKPLSLFVTHLKSMTNNRGPNDARQSTMAIREAEAGAIRRIIETRFGVEGARSKNFAICGDMNDYQERLVISGNKREGYHFTPATEPRSALDVFSRDGFAINPVLRRPVDDRWTLYHSRGPKEQHLCQLDYIWLSTQIAQNNPNAIPEIIREGQPYRTIFPEGQEVERFPRTGWDRPKASDHCPVVVSFDL